MLYFLYFVDAVVEKLYNYDELDSQVLMLYILILLNIFIISKIYYMIDITTYYLLLRSKV